MVRGPRSLLVVTLCLALAAGTALPALAASAPTGEAHLAGSVFGPDLRTPATGLEVRVLPAGEKRPIARTVTDRRGRFDAGRLPAGEYLLVLLRDGEPQPVAAARVTARAGEDRPVVLALPGAEAAEAAPASSSGLAAWIATPLGATVALVAAAVVIGVAADSMADDTARQPDASPWEPTRD